MARGAADLAAGFIAKSKRDRTKASRVGNYKVVEYLDSLIPWQESWNDRASKRDKGLGMQQSREKRHLPPANLPFEKRAQ